MGKAPPQPAGSRYSEDVEQGLNLLRVVYEECFTSGYDTDLNVFWVIKDGNIGTVLTAAAPAELGKLIEDTWGGR